MGAKCCTNFMHDADDTDTQLSFQSGQLLAIVFGAYSLAACTNGGWDTNVEPETPAAVSASDATGWGVIPHVRAEAKSVNEKYKILAVEVRLVPQVARQVAVNYMTVDGSAKAGADYQHVKGQFTFNSGQYNRTVEVPIIDDNLDEQEETFTLLLHVSDNAVLDTPEVTLTILDDDNKDYSSEN